MTDYGIAWLSANGRELGPIGGTVGCVEVLREARFGLDYVYPTADRAVVFEGRALHEGNLVREIIRRGP